MQNTTTIKITDPLKRAEILHQIKFKPCKMFKCPDGNHYHFSHTGTPKYPVVKTEKGYCLLNAAYFGKDPEIINFPHWNWATVFLTSDINIYLIKTNVYDQSRLLTEVFRKILEEIDGDSDSEKENIPPPVASSSNNDEEKRAV